MTAAGRDAGPGRAGLFAWRPLLPRLGGRSRRGDDAFRGQLEIARGLVLRGWGVGADDRCVEVRLLRAGRPVPVEFEREPRPDVARALGIEGGRPYGYRLVFGPAWWRDVAGPAAAAGASPLDLEVAGEVRDRVEAPGRDLLDETFARLAAGLAGGHCDEDDLLLGLAVAAACGGWQAVPEAQRGPLREAAARRGLADAVDAGDAGEAIDSARRARAFIDAQDGLAWRGWACAGPGEDAVEAFVVACNDTRLPVAAVRAARRDVAESLAVPRINLGFRCVIPPEVWRHVDDRGACRLALQVGGREIEGSGRLLDAAALVSAIDLALPSPDDPPLADWPSARLAAADAALQPLAAHAQAAFDAGWLGADRREAILALRDRIGHLSRARGLRLSSPDSLHFHLESSSDLAFHGWACDVAVNDEVFELQLEGRPVAMPAVRIPRGDVRDALGVAREDLGFWLPLPVTLWREPGLREGRALRLALSVNGHPVLRDFVLDHGVLGREIVRASRAIDAGNPVDAAARLHLARWTHLLAHLEAAGGPARVDDEARTALRDVRRRLRGAGPLPAGEALRAHVEHADALEFVGWAHDDSADDEAFELRCDGQPVAAEVHRIARRDVQATLAAARERLGFRIPLPPAIWRGRAPGDSRPLRLQLAVNGQCVLDGFELDRSRLAACIEAAGEALGPVATVNAIPPGRQAAWRHLLAHAAAAGGLAALGEGARRAGERAAAVLRMVDDPGSTLSAAIESVSALVVRGWAFDAGADAEAFRLEADGQPLEVPVEREDRPDVRALTGARRTALGFSIPVPASLWQAPSARAGRPVHLRLRINDRAVLEDFAVDRVVLARALDEAAPTLTPAAVVDPGLRFDRRTWTHLLSHVDACGGASSLSPVARDTAARALDRLALAARLEDAGEPDAGLHAGARESLAGLQRRVNDALARQSPARVLQALLEDATLPGALRDRTALHLVPWACEQGVFESLHAQVPTALALHFAAGGDDWALTILLPFLAADGDWPQAARVMAAVARRPEAGWINTEAVAWSVRVALQGLASGGGSAGAPDAREEFLRAFLSLVDALRSDAWSRGQDLHLRRATVDLLRVACGPSPHPAAGASPALSPATAAAAVTTALRAHALQPAFWSDVERAIGTDGLPDAMRTARTLAQAAREAVVALRRPAPGPGAGDVDSGARATAALRAALPALARLHALGVDEAAWWSRELAQSLALRADGDPALRHEAIAALAALDAGETWRVVVAPLLPADAESAETPDALWAAAGLDADAARQAVLAAWPRPDLPEPRRDEPRASSLAARLGRPPALPASRRASAASRAPGLRVVVEVGDAAAARRVARLHADGFAVLALRVAPAETSSPPDLPVRDEQGDAFARLDAIADWVLSNDDASHVAWIDGRSDPRGEVLDTLPRASRGSYAGWPAGRLASASGQGPGATGDGSERAIDVAGPASGVVLSRLALARWQQHAEEERPTGAAGDPRSPRLDAEDQLADLMAGEGWRLDPLPRLVAPAGWLDPSTPQLWPTWGPVRAESIAGGNQLVMRSERARLLAADRAGVLVVAVARDERRMLPHFLAHYRALGAGAFVIVDDGSTDGTVEWLLAQPDVVVYETDTQYRHSHYGVAWQQAVLAAHAQGRWVLLADLDEFLVLPQPGPASLAGACAQLDAEGHDAAEVRMIDMYPRGGLHEADLSRRAPFEAAPCHDRQPLIPWRLGSGRYSSGSTWLSALRHRLVPDAPPNAFTAQKIALLRWAPWVRLSEGLHYASGLDVARRPLFFAHFKFHSGFVEKVEDEIRRMQHYDDAAEYRQYLGMRQAAQAGFHREGISATLHDGRDWSGLAAMEDAPR